MPALPWSNVSMAFLMLSPLAVSCRSTNGNYRENQKNSKKTKLAKNNWWKPSRKPKKTKKPKIFQRWGLGLCTRQVAMSEISLFFFCFSQWFSLDFLQLLWFFFSFLVFLDVCWGLCSQHWGPEMLVILHESTLVMHPSCIFLIHPSYTFFILFVFVYIEPLYHDIEKH